MLKRQVRGILAVAAVGLLCGPSVILSARADEPETKRDPRIARAVEDFDEAREKARDSLLKSFDLALDRLARQTVDNRLKLRDALLAEKERLEKRGLVPWSGPMWPYIGVYQKNMGIASARLKHVYNQAIKRALQEEATDQVNQLRGDLDAVLKPRVVATWRHRFGRGPRRTTFYSNGRINSADSSAKWAFRNGVLILYWPDPRAPGGAWKDVCKVSADGSTYSGKNQHGHRIGGHYVAR